MTEVVRFWALPHSLYSGKVRSYLRYKNIRYREIPATLGQYRRFIIPRTGVSYIPVVQTADDVVIQDSTEIIDALETRFPQRAVYPETPRQHLAALLFELLGDEWLLLPAMHYRWSFLEDDAHRDDVLEHFGLLLGAWAPRRLRRWFGWKVCQPFKNALPLLGVTPRTIPAIEAWYGEFLDQMNRHFRQHPYLLGGRASIGDFGLMGPLYAHLGRDPLPLRMMRQRAPAVLDWVNRMNESPAQVGEWLPGDEVPETLTPVLQRLFAEYWPVLRDTVQEVERWVQAHPGERLRRIIGRHRFRIGGVEDERSIFPYAQWMLQRPLDYYQGLEAGKRPAVDSWLRQVGGSDALQLPIRCRVERMENRLVPAREARSVSRGG